MNLESVRLTTNFLNNNKVKLFDSVFTASLILSSATYWGYYFNSRPKLIKICKQQRILQKSYIAL